MNARRHWRAVAAVLGLCGCSAEGQTLPAWAGELDLDLAREATSVAALAWKVPSPDCPQIYRIEVQYDVPPLREEAGVGWLVLGAHPTHDLPAPVELDEPPPEGFPAPARMFYRGLKVGDEGTKRDIFIGSTRLGPAAPTAPCIPRTGDPLEDALGLGWPVLPGRLTAIDSPWPGATVGGRCTKSAGVDPATGAAGQEAKHLPGVVGPWRETLEAVGSAADQRYAAISSHWSDGHGDTAIWAERQALVAIDTGRPVWTRAIVHHGLPEVSSQGGYRPVQKTWTMIALDECPGSLRGIGWEPPPEWIEQAATLPDPRAGMKDRARSSG